MAKRRQPKLVEALVETNARIVKFETRGYTYGRVYVSVPAEYVGRKARVIVIIYRD